MTQLKHSTSTQHHAATAEALEFGLASSAEPAAVLESLTEACVPAICDGCTVELTAGSEHHHFARPNSALVREVVPGAGGTTVCLPFTDVVGATYAGTVTFAWRVRTPTAGDRLAVALLVDCAVRTLAWHRSERSRLEAEARIDNLERALASSRIIGAAIGIVMTTHKVPKDAAVAALQNASQRTNRKLRALALDVIDTGWLDPALMAVEGPSTL